MRHIKSIQTIAKQLEVYLRRIHFNIPAAARKPLYVLLLIFFVRVIIPAPPLLNGVSFSQAIYDENGRLLRITLAEDDRYRLFTPIEEITPILKKSILLYEDSYFYWHPGFNPLALIRAFLITYVSHTGKSGGSTITMQLARLRYGLNTRTIPGKLLQILRAVQIEFYYSKREIFEAYLNLAPYGGNIEGAGTASRIYFQKEAMRLTLQESLTLALIPQRPAARSPGQNSSTKNDLAEARQRLFERWKIKHTEDSGLNTDEDLSFNTGKSIPFLAPHFTDTILYRLKISSGKHKYNPAGDSRVHTTLNMEMQELTERITKSYLRENRNRGFRNAAVLLINYETMEVKSMIGSGDFFDDSIHGQVNGTLAKRSPGSTLKPFVYALAFEQGIIHPMSMLKDTPTSYGTYNPENFDGKFSGPVFARDALIRSRNIPALYLASKIRKPGLYGFIKANGVENLKSREVYQLSTVLGGAELTMEELVRLYAILANRGVYRELQYFQNNTNKSRIASLFSRSSRKSHRRVIDPRAVYLTLDILGDTPPPGSENYHDWKNKSSNPVYWKTGTSMAFRDAWAIGIFDSFIAATWIGNFDSQNNPAFVGRTAAGPLLFRIVDGLRSLPDYNSHEVPGAVLPEGVSLVKVCSVSGALPGDHCRTTEYTPFIPGVSPIQRCQIHREVLIDTKTGLRACGKSAHIRPEIYEFFPSDMLEMFEEAGIPKRRPPAYGAECKEKYESSGLSPEIVSPVKFTNYTVRLNERKKSKIVLKAIADADVEKLYWFADESYIGFSSPGDSLLWSANPGKYILRIVDDHGRSSSMELKVELVD